MVAERKISTSFFHSQRMSKLSLLSFQYSFSKNFQPKPTPRWGSKHRQLSGLSQVFVPNAEEMRQVFDKIDTNKDGKISKEEYKSLLRALRKQNVEAEVEMAFEVADSNGDGFIDFKEFMDVHKRGGGVRKMDIQNAFRTFDLDENGRIDAEELFEVLKRLGERCDLETCKRIVERVDADGDGSIDMEDFTKMMTHTMKLL